jgi:hypothetical protein
LKIARGALISVLAITGVAHAQQASTPAPPQADTTRASSDRIDYPASYFAQFTPQTALDMINQTPGFSLDSGDERRGFAGAVGNVLIDGARPVAKSQTLDTILAQIPADQVVRIEILRGAQVAGDASGQAVLVNIVRTPSGGAGIWNAGFEYASLNIVAPRADVSYTGRTGQIDYGISGRVRTQYRRFIGVRNMFDNTDNLTGHADLNGPNHMRQFAVSGNIGLPLAGGRLSATSELSWQTFGENDSFAFHEPDGTPTTTLFLRVDNPNLQGEVGLNYDRDLGPWSMSLIGLANRQRAPSAQVGRFEDADGDVTSTFDQQVRVETSESILRGTLTRTLSAQHRIEFGAEGAINTLDQRLSFIQDTGAGPESVPIGNANVSIEENRADFFGVHTWQPSPRWSLESRLAWETSTLTFSGDDEQIVELSFWKPSLQLTRSFTGGNQVRLRLYRDVGQLNFRDFVSAASVADARVDGGNTDLVPQTDWRAELGADLRFPGGAALRLTATRHWFRDVADLVFLPAPLGFDAPGNIGDADATSLDVDFSTPLHALIPGAQLSINGSLWDTSVTDPITGRPRILSSLSESEVEIEFRQDVPAWKFSWGIEASFEGETQDYRSDEVFVEQEGPWVDVFAEFTGLPNGLRLRTRAINVFDGHIQRGRLFYAPDRTGSLDSYELQDFFFENGAYYRVELVGAF